MLENGGKARPVEYSCSEATLGTIVTDLILMAQQELDLLPAGPAPMEDGRIPGWIDGCFYGAAGFTLHPGAQPIGRSFWRI